MSGVGVSGRGSPCGTLGSVPSRDRREVIDGDRVTGGAQPQQRDQQGGLLGPDEPVCQVGGLSGRW
ncbi:hypothetical protein DEAB109302_02970 [Dermacoccus abyssi]